MVSDSDLVTQLREILRSSDLETATPASVRRQLEAYFGVELTDKKAFVRKQIDAFLENDAVLESKPENQNEEVEEEIEEEVEDCNGDDNDDEKTQRPVKKAKKRGGGFNKICKLSPQLDEFLGTSQLARTEVVKKMWAYIREHDLQDPKNKRNIICDESLHSLFRVKTVDMFQMNKALAKHIWPLNGDRCVTNVKEEDEDETPGESDKKEEQNEEAGENNEEESEEEEDRSVQKRKKRKIRPAKTEENTKKRGGGFSKVCSLSPQLQAFTGMPQLARTEVVKMLWSYLKDNNLQDPSDKRTIICDESLWSLFAVESINMFQMNKHLTKHIWPLVQENEGTANDPKKGKQETEIEKSNDETNEKDAISSSFKTEEWLKETL